MTRARIRAAALLAVTFLAGLLLGAVLDRALIARARPAATAAEQAERRDRLFDRLELAPDQRAFADSVLRVRTDQAAVVWEDARVRLAAIVDSAGEEVRTVLEPPQRERWDRWLERWRRRSPLGEPGR